MPLNVFMVKSISRLLKLQIAWVPFDKLYSRLLYNSGSQPGVRVPLGVREKLIGGTPNFKNHSKQAYLCRIFDLGGTRRGWNFDLGVHRGEQS
jgi:hypothetical protein